MIDHYIATSKSRGLFWVAARREDVMITDATPEYAYLIGRRLNQLFTEDVKEAVLIESEPVA
jgi:hypothetical protein